MPKPKLEPPTNPNYLEEIWKRFKVATEDPTLFLLPLHCEKQENIRMLLQNTYRISIKNEVGSHNAADILPELVIEDMDEEQIWQQLELKNSAALSKYIEASSKLLSAKETKLEIRLNEEDQEGSENDESLEDVREETSVVENEIDTDAAQEESEEEVLQKEKKKVKPSVVDDKFFKLREMEEFLEQEDTREVKKTKKPVVQEDGVDYFSKDLGIDDDDDDEAEANPTYKDFFESDEELQDGGFNEAKRPNNKDHLKETERDEEDDSELEESVNKESEEQGEYKNVGEQHNFASSSDSDSDLDNAEKLTDEAKSSFELREARLLQRMRDYEEEVLGEKPWQLKGEVQATNRPQNSLLEEILEFETTMAPTPVITEETTRCLEDIILQRIKDQAWDDVERKVRPIQTPHDYRKRLVLDQEKSKESLAQIYEKEYQRELDKLDVNRNTEQITEEEPKEHKEIRRLLHDLFIKLDALSNFHFIPKPVAPEAKIITNIPAVEMEEVAPVSVSDAKLLAPEELYRGPKNGLLGKTERNRTDKNRERRKKKQKQRAVNMALEAKIKKKEELGIAPKKREESAKLLKSLTQHRNIEKIKHTNDQQKALKSSKSFFSKLQDTTSGAHKVDATTSAKKRKLAAAATSVKKLKL